MNRKFKNVLLYYCSFGYKVSCIKFVKVPERSLSTDILHKTLASITFLRIVFFNHYLKRDMNINIDAACFMPIVIL